MEYRDHRQAFDDAVKSGALSDDPKAENYAGHWMYMHSNLQKKIDFFKNINYRNYIEVSFA